MQESINSLHYYPFRKISTEDCTNFENVKIHYYLFKIKELSKKKNKKIVYIVRIEEHQHHFFVIKFYPQRWKNYARKYIDLTNENKARSIIYTCLEIILTIGRKNSLASFAFIGSPTNEEIKRGESKLEKTKRFRVYSTFVKTYFSYDNYEHIVDVDKSAYAIMSRKAIEANLYIKQELTNYFDKIYNLEDMFNNIS
jgi:hypothetical protein